MKYSSLDTEKLRSISLKKIGEKVSEIKKNLDKDQQKVITFSKNFTISLSNYCQNQCGYCFYNHRIQKNSTNLNTTLISDEKVKYLMEKAKEFECREALMMSGEYPDSFQTVKDELKLRGFDKYLQFLVYISKTLLDMNFLPHTNIGLISFDSMKVLKEYNASIGLMLESTSNKLLLKGGVHEFSPGKLPEKRIEFIENAGRLKIPFTTGLLLGIGENERDRINDLITIKQLYNKYGHIQEIIIQNFMEKKYIPYQPKHPISLKEILRTIGFAKIIMENEIAIQIAPNLLRKFEKEAISMGVNDFGGISPITFDYINPNHPWPQIEYLRKICEKEGYVLRERLPVYEKFINKVGFCSEKIKNIIKNIS